MAAITIETLIPSSGAVPANGYDPVSQAGFTEWEVGDEAHFSVVVPEPYLPGNDVYLQILESSLSPGARHQWEITTLLMRPGLHATGEQSPSEVFALECQAASMAELLTVRTIAVTGATGPGQIQDVSINAGDALCFTVKRIAASIQEDPVPVRVFNLSLTARVDESAVSNCAGRVGNIFDTVRDLFNESTGGFLPDDFILRCLNRCQQDLAQEDYWRRETWIPAASGENRLDMLAAIPRFQNLHQVHYSGSQAPMVPLASFEEYEELKTASNTAGLPEYYIAQNDSLYVWPPSSTDLSSGFCVYHSHLPEDLTCFPENPDPPVPRAHDMVFVYFVLKQAFLRDRHAPGAEIKFQEYSQLFEKAKRSLLGEAEPPRLAVRPYR
jgi:hypothetical protein